MPPSLWVALAAIAGPDGLTTAVQAPTVPGAPGFATLHVGVHREAGTELDVAADGAAGQCEVVRSRISCPATGPVRFRWGAGGAWELVGEGVVAPGQVGTAWVLAPEEQRVENRVRLRPADVTADVLRDVFVRTGADPIEAPSFGMLTDMWDLAGHPDVSVRMALLDAIVPWWRHTASDPLSVDAPSIVPIELLDQLADDPQLKVRRRLANRLREVWEPGNPLQVEAQRVLLGLAAEGGAVQRAAMNSLSLQGQGDEDLALVAWEIALDRVATDGPPGRAAANTLGRLADELDPDEVDAATALDRVHAYHRERTWNVWAAWAEHVPFDAVRAESLLRTTVGLSLPLVDRWAETEPEALAELLSQWEPLGPHSERYEVVARALERAPTPR